MKIYTATGDKGITSLFSGERIPKSHIQVKAYGDVDELNADLGVLPVSVHCPVFSRFPPIGGRWPG